MRITKYSIVAIVSVLLVTGFVAYSIHATFLTAEDPEKRLLEEHEKVTEKGIPDFGPEVFEEMEKDPRVLDMYGVIPRFETDGERRNWLDELDEVKNRVRSKMPPYFYPEGPVIGYGYNYRGYFRVMIEENLTVKESLMDEIYEMINKEAEGMGIQEVPVAFKLESFPEVASDT